MALKQVTGREFKKSRSFKDLSINLLLNPFTKDVSAVQNDNAIKQSIRNLVLTSFGERPFQPTIGSRVRGLLFEPFDVFMSEDLKDEISNTIERLEPRVQLVDVDVRLSEDEHSIDVGIEYAIVGQPQTQVVEFLLERT